jgi:hypothetical protein
VEKRTKEILNDSSIQLVLSSQIANERAPLGVRAMKMGKDFLSDKPGITTVKQLADVRKTIAETKRIYGIMYSERLEVKAAVYAGELIRQGAIGKVIQTMNIAPHRFSSMAARQAVEGADRTGSGTRNNMGASSAISVLISWISFSSTRDRPRPRSLNRRLRMCGILIIRSFRTSATWCCAGIAGFAMCVSTGLRQMDLVRGETGACSYSEPTDTLRFGSTPTWR